VIFVEIRARARSNPARFCHLPYSFPQNTTRFHRATFFPNNTNLGATCWKQPSREASLRSRSRLCSMKVGRLWIRARKGSWSLAAKTVAAKTGYPCAEFIK
jgi:hypothetical protein